MFGIGAICGFIVGAPLVAVLKPRDAQLGGGTPKPPSVSTDDGLAGIDPPVLDRHPASPAPKPVATTGDATPTIKAAPPADLARRDLEIPVEGVKPEQLVRSFEDPRSGSREHEALDILAPRN